MDTTTTINVSTIQPEPSGLPGTDATVEIWNAVVFFSELSFLLVIVGVLLTALFRIYKKLHMTDAQKADYPIMRAEMWAIFGISILLFCGFGLFVFVTSWFYGPGAAVQG